MKNLGESLNEDTKCRCGINEMVERRDVTSHARTLIQLMMQNKKKHLTMNMLIREWRQKPARALQWYIELILLRCLDTSTAVHLLF